MKELLTPLPPTLWIIHVPYLNHSQLQHLFRSGPKPCTMLHLPMIIQNILTILFQIHTLCFGTHHKKKQFIVLFSILLKCHNFSWELNSFLYKARTLFIIFQKLYLRLRHIFPWALVTAGFRFSNENWSRWNPVVRKSVPMIRLSYQGCLCTNKHLSALQNLI